MALQVIPKEKTQWQPPGDESLQGHRSGAETVQPAV